MDLSSGNVGKGFGLDPLGKIINGDKNELFLRLTDGERL